MILLPPALGLALRAVTWGAWVGVGLTLALGLAIGLARPRARSLVLLGTVLAAFASLKVPQLSRPGSAPALIDLRTEELSGQLRGTVRITGFFRDEWVLAEYAVPQGTLPQQDDAAAAQLVPFVGVEEGAIPLRGAVLIARVRPGQQESAGLQTLQGRARALEDELLETFVQASGLQVPPGVQGVLLDTLGPGDPSPPWLQALVVTLALLAAFVCLWLATGSSPAPRGRGNEPPRTHAP